MSWSSLMTSSAGHAMQNASKTADGCTTRYASGCCSRSSFVAPQDPCKGSARRLDHHNLRYRRHRAGGSRTHSKSSCLCHAIHYSYDHAATGNIIASVGQAYLAAYWETQTCVTLTVGRSVVTLTLHQIDA